ncbi:hypothetical protein FSZ31_05260 [Sphingorhabdus soli]|uniref:Uncharacterized protein n=2 Tax=Flavisphingopyxis soli TaxID=2601267 RepID=A0A5C6UTS6_9SPHN|nr:hypothetical protein FSZ31_05260 [Sphingorhabdus soli]
MFIADYSLGIHNHGEATGHQRQRADRMIRNLGLGAGLAAIAALTLGGCGDKQDDGSATTTTRLDAVDVPQGTISDELMPLDTRNESSAVAASTATNETAAPAAAATKPAAESQASATDSESETDQ